MGETNLKKKSTFAERKVKQNFAYKRVHTS